MILEVAHSGPAVLSRFAMSEEKDVFDDIAIEVGDTKSRSGSCVNIVIDKGGKHGMIQTAVYRPMCEIGGKMEAHRGTILMLQGALRYAFSKYKKLQYITLNDKSMVAKKDIHITAKRLLQQRPGWYQEWLGAEADDKDMATKRVLQALSTMKPSDEDRDKMSAKGWGSTKEVEEMARKYLGRDSGAIVGTAWKIMRKVAMGYPIDIQTHLHGGGSNRRKRGIDDMLMKHSAKVFEMWRRLTYG